MVSSVKRHLQEARYVLTHPEEVQEQCEQNYELAKRYYSFTMLERRLKVLLSDCFGESE